MLYAGMDVHKRFCQIIVCTKEGEVVKKGRIKTDEKEIREFFYGLKNVKVAIEASANYSYIVDALAKEGYEVLVAHPLRTRAIAEAKIKSDKIDAKILADLARGNLFPKIKNKIHGELINLNLPVSRLRKGDIGKANTSL